MKKLMVLFVCLMMVGASCKKKDMDAAKEVLDIVDIVVDAAKDITDVIPVTAESVPVISRGSKHVAPRSVSGVNVSYYSYQVGSWHQDGECLSVIADKVYGDASSWEIIYDINKDKCPHPDVVYEGSILKIAVVE